MTDGNPNDMHTPALFASLNRRPAAVTVTVRELLQKVGRGEVRVPKFQRPLRWKSENVVQLLDSVWRGYPIGSLLFWKRKAEHELVLIGGATIEGPEVSDAWWVVDGQQRTTALAASLLDLDHAGDSRWYAHFDPSTGAFKSGLVAPSQEGRDVPLSVLGDLKRFGRWVRDSSLDEELINRAEDAQQRLLDYSIPAYVVDTDDEQALRGVFARLNSTGARMRADEVFQALLGAASTNSKSSLDLDILQQACEIDGFGVPSRAEILKSVLAMSGADPTRRLETFGVTERLELVSPEDATEALRRTISFLQNYCGIPHVSLLPYPVVFTILSRWFHVHPASERATLTLLARWLWRGTATSAHHRAEVAQMRHQVRDIKENKEQESLTQLLRRVARKPAPPWELRSFDLRNARSRVETLALLGLKPQDRLGPISISELMSSGRIAREIFRSKETIVDDTKLLLKSAANRVLLGSSHTGLANELKGWSWDRDEPALTSHLIDEVSFARLQEGDIDGFLVGRARSLTRLVESFLEARAGWDKPDIRPRSAYMEQLEL